MTSGMPKQKTTGTVERRKVDEVQRLTGAASTSAAIDLALDRLIRTERLRRDIVAYTGAPPSEDEIALGTITPAWTDLGDETDWAALYAVDE
jgi:hypothetical protein